MQLRDQHVLELDPDTVDRINRLFEYYDQTWMNFYTPERFCVNGVLHRTNNFVEAMNGRLKRQLGIHPNIFVFIGEFI